MRLHEAAPKLIIQERVGDKMKLSSYCPVASLTRAALALGRLHTTSQGIAYSPSLTFDGDITTSGSKRETSGRQHLKQAKDYSNQQSCSLD